MNVFIYKGQFGNKDFENKKLTLLARGSEKNFFRHHHQNLAVGGGDFLEKKIFCSKKNFFLTKNIEYSVSKTLRQKLRQV